MAAKSSIGAAGVPWRFRRLAAGCLFPTVLLLAGNLLASDDPMAAARQRLSAMSAAEKQELEGKQARFHGLSESEQQRVRQVHQDLSEAEDGEKLKQIMHRYSKWLRSLPSGQRAELVSLPPESRLERIKTLLREQEEGRMRWFVMRELTAGDLALIVRWMEDYVAAHEAEILERLPHLKERWDSFDPEKRRSVLVFSAATMGPVREFLRPGEADIQSLKKDLSATAKQEFNKAESEGRLAELAERWLRAAMFSRRTAPEVPREALQKFYAELEPRTREYLENLSAERMEQELVRLYHYSQFRKFFDPDRSPFPRPGEGMRGRPRGGGRPPGGDRSPGPPPGDRPDQPHFGPPGYVPGSKLPERNSGTQDNG
jgi:hypothetical protein